MHQSTAARPVTNRIDADCAAVAFFESVGVIPQGIGTAHLRILQNYEAGSIA